MKSGVLLKSKMIGNIDNKILLIVTFILIFSIVSIFVFFLSQPEKKWGKVCFKEYCFDVQLAQNSIDRTKGLMFKKSLKQNEGMLFLFDKEAKYSFWMKNTLIPLDIIWINKDNKIVFISESNQPCRRFFCPLITPVTNAKYVLEVNSGIIQKIGLKLADELSLKY